MFFSSFRRTLVTLHLAEGVAEDVAVSQKSKKEEERMREDKKTHREEKQPEETAKRKMPKWTDEKLKRQKPEGEKMR